MTIVWCSDYPQPPGCGYIGGFESAWEFDEEAGAFADFALDGDFAAVGFDDGFDEAETEAEAALGAAFVDAVEALPDAVELRFGDAFAGVGDVDQKGAVVLLRMDSNPALLGSVLDGIVHQIAEGALEAPG